MRSVFTSYLARIGWRGRSSARLESWWPHTRTSLGLFPRCSRSAALLQDGRGDEKREKRQKCLVEFAEEMFPSRDVRLSGLLLLYFDPRVSSLLLHHHPIKNSFCYYLCEAPSEWPRALKHQRLYFPVSLPMKWTENSDEFKSEMYSIKFWSWKTSLKMTFYKLRRQLKDLLLSSEWFPSYSRLSAAVKKACFYLGS